MTTPFIEKLKDPKNVAVSVYEIARELNAYYKKSDEDSVKLLRDTYVTTQISSSPNLNVFRIKHLVQENLALAAGLADKVSECGYEKNSQLQDIKLDGPIAKFVTKAIEYDSKK